jgi:GTP pyrophosphokinase
MNIPHVSLEDIASELKCSSVDDLYAQVGFGDRRAPAVAGAALQLERTRADAADTELRLDRAKKKKRPPSGLSLDGVNDIEGNRARCCNPLPGDAVVGFVSRGRGMVIHRRDCAQILETREPERLVDIDWGADGGELHAVALEVHANDRPGLLGELLKLVAHLGVYITGAQAHADRKGSSVIQLALEFRSTRHVAQVLDRLDRHPEVTFVRRADG